VCPGPREKRHLLDLDGPFIPWRAGLCSGAGDTSVFISLRSPCTHCTFCRSGCCFTCSLHVLHSQQQYAVVKQDILFVGWVVG